MKTLIYDITNKCNLKCKHCYNSHYFNENRNRLNPLELKNIIEYLNFERIHIVGGEPLLEPMLFPFINSLNSTNISINTNGLLLNDNIITKINSCNNLDQITISLDGATKETYKLIRQTDEFEKLIHIIFNFTSKVTNSISVNISFVITKDNHTELITLMDLVNHLKIENLFLSQLYLEGNAALNYYSSVKIEPLCYSILALFKYIENNKCYTNVYLDAKPAFYYWLYINGINFRSDSTHGHCPFCDGNLYADCYGNFYCCGPHSKLFKPLFRYNTSHDNSLHKINKAKHSAFVTSKNKICSTCCFKIICNSCFLNVNSYTYYMCEFALKEIYYTTSQFLNKSFKFKKYIHYNSTNNILINFLSKETFIINHLKNTNLSCIDYNSLNFEQKLEFLHLLNRGFYDRVNEELY